MLLWRPGSGYWSALLPSFGKFILFNQISGIHAFLRDRPALAVGMQV